MTEPIPVDPNEDVDFDLQKYLPQKWYDFLKALSTIFLPALATLILVLGSQWDWASNEKIAGTVTALAAFLGLLVRTSAQRYKKATNVGDVVIERTPEGKRLYSLEVRVPFEQIEQLDTLTFGVKK